MPREDIPIIEPYNPLDKRNLGASVAAAMLYIRSRQNRLLVLGYMQYIIVGILLRISVW